jgi:hypothetical protein
MHDSIQKEITYCAKIQVVGIGRVKSYSINPYPVYKAPSVYFVEKQNPRLTMSETNGHPTNIGTTKSAGIPNWGYILLQIKSSIASIIIALIIRSKILPFKISISLRVIAHITDK